MLLPHGETLLRARDVSKRFHGTQALERVSFEAARGEVHTLVGENGAGKSTLIKVLSGLHQPDSGQIRLDGRLCRFAGPREAQAAGIVVIPQEMQFVAAATVAESITLGEWPTRRLWGLVPAVDGKAMRERARTALARLDVHVPLDERMDALSFSERQLVIIAWALCRAARLLILDEPTASLEHRESERLFAILERLRAEGVAIVYISHRLDEVVRLSDRCTVLRDGRVVGRCSRGEISKDGLVRLMTGRDLDELERPHQAEFGPPVLEHDLKARGETADDSVATLTVRGGQMVGLAGLLGSGTTALLRRLFGAEGSGGTIRVAGKPVKVRHPAEAIAGGLGLVPGERRLGLVMSLSVRDNILLPHLDRFVGRLRLDSAAANVVVGDLMDRLDIRPRDPDRLVGTLSGGNQQKVIFARWLAGKALALLLDEPTQGIDIAAKARIHRLMHDFVAQGGGIVFTSSDMVEALSLGDELLAMRRGKVVARMARGAGEYSEKRLHDALGG